MSTIVTYNRGGQGPNSTLARVADPTLGASFFTDFVTLDGVTATDAALSVADAHAVLIDDDGVASGIVIGNTQVTAASMIAGDIAFGLRAKVSSTRAANDKASFGFATSAAAAANFPAQATNFCMELTQGSSAAADVVQCSFDDGTNEKEDNVTVSTVTGLADFDATEYHVYSGVCTPTASGGFRVQYFIDDILIKEYKLTARGACGVMQFGAATNVNLGSLTVDYLYLTAPAS
jgi:hypothetical protein